MLAADALAIPGQIELSEAVGLITLFQSIDISPEDAVVEFGTYYGRSTFCIANSLKSNPQYDLKTNLFLAYDSFETAHAGVMAPYVIADAKKYKILHLLTRTQKTIGFYEAFKHYMVRHNVFDVITPVKAKLFASYLPPGRKVAAMHIDSPKFYDEFKVILIRFFPLTKVGATLIFQDFFLQWSATLIASVAHFINNGSLRPISSSASSLVCRLDKPIAIDQITELDINMASTGFILSSIDNAIQLVQDISLDRKEHFIPRLKLAKLQYLYQNKAYKTASKLFMDMVATNDFNSASVLADFANLLSEGFSMREKYDADEKA